MRINNFIRNSIFQIAIFSIFTQAAFAGTNDINLDLSSPSNKQLIQEYVPIDLTWDFLRQLEKTNCSGINDTDNSIKQNGTEFTANSLDIQKALPYTNKLSFPTLTKATFNPDDQIFDLTYQYKYLFGNNYEFIIRAKPSADKTQEFETKLGNLVQQAPEKVDDFVILEDRLDNSSNQSSSSADLSLIVQNDFDDLLYFDDESYPIIIKNKSDHLVVIRQGNQISSIAPHETVVKYINSKQNFRMYRINPASSVVNIAGSIGAAGAVATISTTLATGACMLVSAPLSIPIITGASIIGGAGFTLYKFVKAAKKRCPITSNEVNPDEIDSESITKITITNAEDESTIDTKLKLVNSNKLLNKVSQSFFYILSQFIDADSKNNQLAEDFQQRFAELTSEFKSDLELNTKTAKLVLLLQELRNMINPPKQISTMEKLINFVKNPENRDAVITLVKAVK
ncbi:MAG: hypothetical protein Q8S31_07265 [Alphaproteobacteria bacterium]|nr:hypothetical protein [Alphaproteobacteria bacterium]